MVTKRSKKAKLETQYQELFRVQEGSRPAPGEPEHDQSFEQPSPLKIVQSVTTYGAHEEPI